MTLDTRGSWPWICLQSKRCLACSTTSHAACMEKQDAASALANLPGNVLQDIGSHLDGHSLLALLRTCCDLHGSHALWACLFAAVMQQMAALQAALHAMVTALPVARRMLQRHESFSVMLSEPTAFQLLSSPVWLQLRLVIQQQGSDSKDVALAHLKQAKLAVQQAQAVWQPGQELPQLGPLVVQARHMAVEALQVPQLVIQNDLWDLLMRVGEFGEELEAGLGQRMIESLMQRASQVLEQQEQERLQEALQPVLVGQPQAGDALQAVQQSHTQWLKQLYRDTLQAVVQAGQQDLRDGQGNIQRLQVAVQEGQALLQYYAEGH